MSTTRERILGLLVVADARGATAHEIRVITNIWETWGAVTLLSLERSGVITSRFDAPPYPRQKRYWLRNRKIPC